MSIGVGVVKHVLCVLAQHVSTQLTDVQMNFSCDSTSPVDMRTACRQQEAKA